MTCALRFLAHGCFLFGAWVCSAASYQLAADSLADRALVEYFERETSKLEAACLADVKTLDDWKAKRDTYRKQLFEMLSLSPLPPRGDLRAEVTGKTDHPQFTVEHVQFQSSPGLYVTANLYMPKDLAGPAPTILYLSGHGPVISNGVSYGNKVTYQHHGGWFARNGYVCMILDTLQLGEIQGLHHGTHRAGMWWWNSRGYTPAGVEAWNSIRALDYLETRKEVDAQRFGVTGRSGGGAYSWWVAALDDRVKAAAPVAGITDLRNHVVDGVVEGHCDCMFTVNTYGWDYAQVAALVAPRPLLICNTDSDYIFPLDGVVRLHTKVKRIYELHGALNKLGLLITEGPHKDTQDLQVPVFRWFNRHLKGEEPLVELAATKLFQPQQLKVFAALPSDSVNTNIHHSFVPAAKMPEPPRSKGEWEQLRNGWMAELRKKAFAAWPTDAGGVRLKEAGTERKNDFELRMYDFESQPSVPLRLYVVKANAEARRIELTVLDDDDELNPKTFEQWPQSPPAVQSVYFAPRGIGPNRWKQTDRKQVQIRRRFMLLGQTVDAMRVWDIRRAIQAVQQSNHLPLWIEARGNMAVSVVYASLFETNIAGVVLADVPLSHQDGPDYLNVMRVLDVPAALAMAAERAPLQLEDRAGDRWAFPRQLAQNLGWAKNQFILRAEP